MVLINNRKDLISYIFLSKKPNSLLNKDDPAKKF